MAEPSDSRIWTWILIGMTIFALLIGILIGWNQGFKTGAAVGFGGWIAIGGIEFTIYKIFDWKRHMDSAKALTDAAHRDCDER